MQAMREFLSEVRVNAPLRTVTLMVAGVEVLGFSHLSMMPSLARDVLGVGAGGLGLLNSINSLGGLAALIVISFVGTIRRQGMLFILVNAVFGVGLLLLGVSAGFFMAVIAVLVVSAMMSLSDLLGQALLRVIVSNEKRGRAMGAWVVAVGTSPLGNLQIGALASAFTVGAALILNGGGLVLLALITLAGARSLRRL
jgi:predicted MFS family arabinose efflux permease